MNHLQKNITLYHVVYHSLVKYTFNNQFQTARCYFSSTVYIYPLTESMPLSLPKTFTNEFISTQCHLFNLPCYLNNDSIIHGLSNTNALRRAELFYQKQLSDHHQHLHQHDRDVNDAMNSSTDFSDTSQSARCQHQTRQSIQVALYRYVLNNLLGLSDSQSTLDNSTTNTNISSSSDIPLLLDLGCGIHQTDIINHYQLSISNFSRKFIPICIDLFSNNDHNNSSNSNHNHNIHFLKCNLLKRHSSQSSSSVLLPFPDYSMHYIISISFVQWLLIPMVYQSYCLENFLLEIIRLLNQSFHNAQCVIQFYPSKLTDLQLMCETIGRQSHSKFTGCLLISRPISDRGMKIFIYLTCK
ncbi:unnamed protein product [Schistosoma turkestanicum]|nr:unnamed protein product [Schistosoma turkestanicum]